MVVLNRFQIGIKINSLVLSCGRMARGWCPELWKDGHGGFGALSTVISLKICFVFFGF
jgi:hypothetical protein